HGDQIRIQLHKSSPPTKQDTRAEPTDERPRRSFARGSLGLARKGIRGKKPRIPFRDWAPAERPKQNFFSAADATKTTLSLRSRQGSSAASSRRLASCRRCCEWT